MHTPTPWYVGTDPEGEGDESQSVWTNQTSDGTDGTGAEIAGRICEPANAAFIVRACNSHDALAQVAEWAEAAFSYLMVKAASADDRAEFKRRFEACRVALQTAKE